MDNESGFIKGGSPTTGDTDIANPDATVQSCQESQQTPEKRCGTKITKEWGEAMDQNVAKRIRKNIFMLGLMNLFLYMAHGGLSNLQSSLHVAEGLGVISQSTTFAVSVPFCLTICSLCIQRLGHRLSIGLSIGTFALWAAVNGYATWATMIIAVIILGFGGSTYWVAQNAYVAVSAQKAAAVLKEKEGDTISKYFGVIHMLYTVGRLLGSFASWLTLRLHDNNVNVTNSINYTCGAEDCPLGNITGITTYERPDAALVWTLVSICVAATIGAIATVVLFIDPLPPSWINRLDECHNIQKPKWSDTLISALKFHKDSKQILLIPLAVYTGLIRVFVEAEFSKSFVTCSLGIWMVGLVAVPSIVLNAATAYVAGHLIKHVGRMPVVLTAVLLDIFVYIVSSLWVPGPGHIYIFFVISAVFGISNGIWQAQITALHGALFPNDSGAAFSNMKSWQSVGLAVGFGYSSFLCMRIKIYINIVVLCIATICYIKLEIPFGSRVGNRDKTANVNKCSETTNF